MKNEFNWKDFRNNKIAVHCDTEEKAKAFLKECEKQGIMWHNYTNKDLTYWYVYKQNTYYVANGNFLAYGNIINNSYYKRLHTFIDYSFDFAKDNNVSTKEKIVITNNGKTTTANLYNGKKLVKSAVSNCHPNDEFDFIAGAELALKRLKEKEFKPHLKSARYNCDYGCIGEKTDLTGFGNEPLYVGDVVELYDYGRKISLGETIIVYDEQYFVMGCCGIKFTNGMSNIFKWEIHKVKNYKDLQDGDIYDNIEVVLKEKE